MHRFVTAFTLGTLLTLQPVPAIAQDLNASLDEIDASFEQGFDEASNGSLIARDLFLKAAHAAEKVLATHPDLDARTKRDMHQHAANGYYYAAEKEHWSALDAEDSAALTAAKINHLVKALAHHAIIFADGQDGLLVAEYLFGTSMLVEHGIKTDDSRTAEWSKANVHAGRLRIDESKMFGNDNHYSAMSDLAAALLDFAKVTGDEAAQAEAAELVTQIPEDERTYDLRERLR